MRKRLTAVALAGTVGLGAVGAAVAYPALADNAKAKSESPQAVSAAGQARRTAVIRQALKGLVDDKTLTAAQADKVASTLGQAEATRGPLGGAGLGRPGGPLAGGGLLGVEGPQADEAAAKVLGLTVDQVRTALRGGSTLAQLAKKQGKVVNALVSALVSVAKDRLAAGVKAGRITQQTATQIEKTLEQRVLSVVQNGRPGPGFRGERHWDQHSGSGMPWPARKPPNSEGSTPTPSGSTTSNSSGSA
jgi:hypothetical protein